MIKKFLIVTIAITLLLIIVLAGLYFLPPGQEEIRYNYVTEEPIFNLNPKVGWYKTTEGLYYQVTWGAKTGLQLNYFDSLRINLKSFRLSPLSEDNFDANGDTNTIEAIFEWITANSTYILKFNGKKTKFEAIKQDSLYYNQREVNYYNRDIKLSGLLLQPYNNKNVAFVFIHGSGFSDRDNFWYMYQADFLARQGFTVLLPDKRGCGKSFGEWHTASFYDFAEDAISAIQFLENDPSTTFDKVGILGLSQGGWISHIVAHKSESVDFIIDVVSSATTPNEQIKHEIKNDIINSGVPGFLAEPLALVFTKRAKSKRKIWWELNGEFDPISLMEKSKTPTLKILAANDEMENVPVKQSEEAIKKLFETNIDIPLTLKLYRDSGHALFSAETKWIRSDYLQFVVDWMLKL
jgi:dipeptidyl aminopeptidase/acylaminoacyl peptidase